MKKILYVLNTGAYSGAENVVIQIIKKLRFENYVGVYVGLEGPIRETLMKEKIEFELIPVLNKNNLCKVIDKVHPDLIHANDYTAVCVTVFCNTGVPIIAHIHNNSSWIKRINFKSVLYAKCVRKVESVLLVSNSVYDEFVFHSVIKDKRILIGNPVDIKNIRSKWQKEEKKIYDLIMLGRFTEAKNHKRAIDIIAQISIIPGLKVVFVGDGELRSEVIQYVKTCNLQETIEIVGFQKNPYEYISKSKVMLMPSKWEGFGIAAVEGLAYGLPVIASDAGGIPNIVNNECGKICMTDGQFVQEIRKLLQDGAYYQQKSEKAIERSNELDNVNDYFKKISRIYDNVLRQS